MVKNCVLNRMRVVAFSVSGFFKSPLFIKFPRRMIRLSHLQNDAFASSCPRPVEKLRQKPRPNPDASRFRIHDNVLQFPLRPMMARHQESGNPALGRQRVVSLPFVVNDEDKPGCQCGPTSRQGGEILPLTPVSSSLAPPLQVENLRNIRRSSQSNVHSIAISGAGLLFELEASNQQLEAILRKYLCIRPPDVIRLQVLRRDGLACQQPIPSHPRDRACIHCIDLQDGTTCGWSSR